MAKVGTRRRNPDRHALPLSTSELAQVIPHAYHYHSRVIVDSTRASMRHQRCKLARRGPDKNRGPHGREALRFAGGKGVYVMQCTEEAISDHARLKLVEDSLESRCCGDDMADITAERSGPSIALGLVRWPLCCWNADVARSLSLMLHQQHEMNQSPPSRGSIKTGASRGPTGTQPSWVLHFGFFITGSPVLNMAPHD